MRPPDQALSQELAEALVSFDNNKHHLPGIGTPEAFGTFIEQLLESIHRVKYVSVLRTRELSKRSADPNSDVFDPLKAAILYQRDGNIDEAFWLVFLLTHFGRHRRAGWLYVQQVYGCLGEGNYWSWIRTSNDPAGFRKWLHDHQAILRPNNIPHGFGNHRKRESLDAYSAGGTGAIVESYINWVGLTRSHENLMQNAYQEAGNDPKATFDYLFHSMDAIVRFGRTARFDYLTMIGHMNLASIEPGFVYLKNSTGPKSGAQLLFLGGKKANIKILMYENWLIELATDLGVSMQVLEDALCNWQKSPEVFKKFRG